MCQAVARRDLCTASRISMLLLAVFRTSGRECHKCSAYEQCISHTLFCNLPSFLKKVGTSVAMHAYYIV